MVENLIHLREISFMFKFIGENYQIPSSWVPIFKEEKKKSYFRELEEFLVTSYENEPIYPQKENIFRSFELCPLDQTKVVILGQDPYHGNGQAQGLSFSVPNSIKTPPSLRNIKKLLFGDNYNNEKIQNDLTNWATQGVLLLNTVLTVKDKSPNSHQLKGWELFTDQIIRAINNKGRTVFILWGSHAIKKKELIDEKRNLVLSGVHPSPLSAYRGFFDTNHFELANKYLKSNKDYLVNWKSISV